MTNLLGVNYDGVSLSFMKGSSLVSVSYKNKDGGYKHFSNYFNEKQLLIFFLLLEVK